MQEPSSDLAIAVAIASSYYDQTVARDVAVLGGWHLPPPGDALLTHCALCVPRHLDHHPLHTQTSLTRPVSPCSCNRALRLCLPEPRSSDPRSLLAIQNLLALRASCTVLRSSTQAFTFSPGAFLRVSPRFRTPLPPPAGEIGLGGEIRSVPQLERRLLEARKLGFNKFIVPAGSGVEARGKLKVGGCAGGGRGHGCD